MIFDQYLLAIGAAKEAIYIKNQAIPIPPVADAIEEALKRGVEVVILVPAQPEAHVREARRDPSRILLFERVAALGRYERFSLVGIAAMNLEGDRRDVYVHGKIMLVDDGAGDNRIVQSPLQFAFGSDRDECIDLGRSGRPRVAARTPERASGAGYWAPQCPRGAQVLSSSRRTEPPKE